jgi:ACT domain-containing protein
MYNRKEIRMKDTIVEVKRERITFCTYKDLIKRFRDQSRKMNKSMSRRIEEFIIKELEKEGK